MSATLRTFVLMAALTALLMGVGFLVGGRAGALAALLFAGAGNLWAWWGSDKAMLRRHDAVPVTRENGSELVDLVAELARNAGLPMPAIYLMETSQPNAFATGRNPDHAAVAITRGLLDTLGRDELAGVIAHELAHIRNRDTLIMTVAATLAGAVAMLGNMAMWTGGRGRRGGLIGSLLMMVLAPLAASLVQMAISRAREFRADALGAQIAGRTDGLSRALEKISVVASQRVNVTAEENPASASMFIINPLNSPRLAALFRTHPPTAERIAALEKLSLDGRA